MPEKKRMYTRGAKTHDEYYRIVAEAEVDQVGQPLSPGQKWRRRKARRTLKQRMEEVKKMADSKRKKPAENQK